MSKGSDNPAAIRERALTILKLYVGAQSDVFICRAALRSLYAFRSSGERKLEEGSIQMIEQAQVGWMGQATPSRVGCT